MDDEFDKRLKEYYRQLRENEKALLELKKVNDKGIIKNIKFYNAKLRKSITKAKLLYDDFLGKLDEVMPEI